MTNRTRSKPDRRDELPVPADAGRPLRVVHVMTALALAGMEFGVIKVSNRIDRRRIEPAIVCIWYETPEGRAILHSSIRVMALGEKPARNWGLIRKLARAFRELRADIVHTHNWGTYAYGVLGARLAGVPVVIHGEHGHDSNHVSRRQALAKRALIPLVNRFVAVSQDLARELVGQWRLRPERVSILPNGVDTEIFRPGLSADGLRRELGFSDDALVITIIGGLRPIKGHATLLLALAKVLPAVPRARLLIVGSDYNRGHRQELIALATELGILPAIRFEEVRSDIRDVLALTAVYVNSSLFEGMSNTILEAMASGKPVVASAVGGNMELIEDGRTGYLVPVQDPGALADRLQSVLTDEALRARLGHAAREQIERHYPISGMVRRYEQLYEEAWARRALRRRIPLRERAKCALARGLCASGVAALSRASRGRPLTILTYHRVLPLADALRYPFQGMVMPRDTFEHQIAHLARHYHVVPFEKGVRDLASGSLPERAVTLTFDDGYRDNHDHAFPVLSRHGLPATFFVVTDVVEHGRRLWWDEVGAMIPGDAPGIVTRLNGATREEREIWLRRARAEHGSGPEDRDGLMMRWDEVEALVRGGMTVGSHTRSHPFLDELSDSEIREELTESLRMLESRTGRACPWLAFPRGRHIPGERGRTLLRESGIAAAVSTVAGLNGRDQDPLALRRIDAGFSRLNTIFHAAQFDVELTDLPPLLRRS